MTPFDYFMIFVTIIIALAIESVARDIDVMIAARKRVRWHWMAPATAANSIVYVLSQFWLLWEVRQHFPFNNFLLALAPVTTMLVLFLTASAALPSEVPPEGLDLKEWYFENRGRYWGLTIAMMALGPVNNAIVYLTHSVPVWQPVVFTAEACVLALWCASLIRFRAVWWHSVSIAIFFVWNIVGNAGLTLH